MNELTIQEYLKIAQEVVDTHSKLSKLTKDDFIEIDFATSGVFANNSNKTYGISYDKNVFTIQTDEEIDLFYEEEEYTADSVEELNKIVKEIGII